MRYGPLLIILEPKFENDLKKLEESKDGHYYNVTFSCALVNNTKVHETEIMVIYGSQQTSHLHHNLGAGVVN